ncbi:hypothetical protein BDN70DRAFT_901812 [Pholiota conissans]|uniref:Uncharacterized protein n=1 Tax=Pholiota conissans TaxID=109636 RepID=A0A9P6CR57_9AGAR|nr:hypothetical protein BDN70DRAFT_901812 [Pholiota conissans]
MSGDMVRYSERRPANRGTVLTRPMDVPQTKVFRDLISVPRNSGTAPSYFYNLSLYFDAMYRHSATVGVMFVIPLLIFPSYISAPRRGVDGAKPTDRRPATRGAVIPILSIACPSAILYDNSLHVYWVVQSDLREI